MDLVVYGYFVLGALYFNTTNRFLSFGDGVGPIYRYLPYVVRGASLEYVLCGGAVLGCVLCRGKFRSVEYRLHLSRVLGFLSLAGTGEFFF